MILLVDIGNTGVKFCLQNESFIDNINYCELDKFFEQIECVYKTSEFSAVYLSSVRTLDDGFKKNLYQLSKNIVIISGVMDLPIKNGYETPSTLGPDRIMAAVAANALFPNKNILIFDFGTCITIDFVNKKGEFLGGNISLGLSTRFKALNHFTSKLPLQTVLEPVSKVGFNTTEAINSGVVLGIIFEVQSYMAQYPDHLVIFSGGDAFYFAEKMKSSIFVVCNLVLIGLSVLSKCKKSE